MDNPVVWGGLICCAVPLGSFLMGMLVAKRGAPIAVQYRWSRASKNYLDESEA